MSDITMTQEEYTRIASEVLRLKRLEEECRYLIRNMGDDEEVPARYDECVSRMKSLIYGIMKG